MSSTKYTKIFEKMLLLPMFSYQAYISHCISLVFQNNECKTGCIHEKRDAKAAPNPSVGNANGLSLGCWLEISMLLLSKFNKVYKNCVGTTDGRPGNRLYIDKCIQISKN